MAISIAKIQDSIFREYSNKNVEMLEEAILNGILLPDDATNGDVIKALFPDGSQVKGASIYIMNDNKSNIFYDFDWWNALYKAGDTNADSN